MESLVRETGLDKKMVRQWYLRYEKYGEDGLRGTRSYHYSAVEKLSIVMEVEEKGIPLQEICLRYDLNRTTIQEWLRKYRAGKNLKTENGGDLLKTLWQDLRRKNHRLSSKSFRRKTSAYGLRMRY